MTEAEWMTCNEPIPMLEMLKGQTSERKMRLATCAFCSHMKDAIKDKFFHAAFNAAEQYADGLVDWEVLRELGSHIDHFARTRDFLQTTAMVLPVYLLIRDVDLGYAAWGSAMSAWNHPVADRQGVVALNVAFLRDIFGNPFHPITFSPSWHTDTALSLARQMYDSRDFSAMPILADALQDAGCDNEDILSHCRGGWPHVRGCWVVDLVFGKE
jgi:hypothetical protein